MHKTALSDMRKERWKLIPGYGNKYMVSDLGRVKDIDYKNTGKEIIISQFSQGKYRRVALFDGEKQVKKLVHRLVAEAFIPIPERLKHIPAEKLDVHHIDFGFSNVSTNLCWLTRKEHQEVHNGKTVFQFNLDGTFVEEYPSAAKASEKTGIVRADIQRCCKGKIKTAGGYQWTYNKSDDMKPVKGRYDRVSETLHKPVILFNPDGTVGSKHNSVEAAAKFLGVSAGCVSDCCRGKQKTTGGYIARYA